MKRISALVLACMILAGAGNIVYAAQETAEQPESAAEAVQTQKTGPECSFSEPQIEKKAAHAEYKTTVSVSGEDLVEGYEIHVKAENKDEIVIENKAGGTATENVYKDGVMYLAVMSGELTGEETELCDITVKLPYDAAESGSVLEIPEIQKVADRCVVFYHGGIQAVLERSEITEERVMLLATNASAIRAEQGQEV